MKNSIWLPKNFDKLIYDQHKQNLSLPVHVKDYFRFSSIFRSNKMD